MPTHRHAVLREDKEVIETVIGYVFREQSMKELAGLHGVSWLTIRRWLKKYGVRIRNTHEQRHCDRRHGKHSQSDAIKAAWKRGAYDTETFRTRSPTGSDQHGENNSFYGKNHSPETKARIAKLARRRSISGLGEYGADWTEDLRKRIVHRDGHRCQVCGSSRGKLQVHHVDLDRRNNIESNLLTLCAACHLAYHGRRELKKEVAAAHEGLLRRLAIRPVVPKC